MAITDKDIKKLGTIFATKEDLEGLRKEVMGGMDKVMGELEKAREDRVFAAGKDREQDRRLDGLEIRVAGVEVKVC